MLGLSPTQKARVVVIGAGRFGTLHAKAFAENPRASLTAVVDTSRSKAELVARNYGTKAYTDINEMISKENPDAVSIATPEGEHKAPMLACAEAGLDIFLEKPIAMTMEDANAIEKAWKRQHVKVMIDFTLRFDPRYALASEVVKSGKIGKLACMHLARTGTSATAKYYGKRTDLLTSTTVHDIDFACWVADSRVKRVYGESVTVLEHRRGDIMKDDGILAILKFQNGTMASIHTSAILPSSAPSQVAEFADIIGTSGEVTISGGQGVSVLEGSRYSYPDTSLWPVISERLSGALKEAVDCFLSCVLSDTLPPVGIEEGKRALQAALAIGESVRKSNPVELV